MELLREVKETIKVRLLYQGVFFATRSAQQNLYFPIIDKLPLRKIQRPIFQASPHPPDECTFTQTICMLHLFDKL